MSDKASDSSLAGIDRLRETAKWLIGAYAAVGAAIIAGLQLTSLGKIEDHTRFWVGAITAAVALLAVVLGIYQVAKILAPVEVDDAVDLGPASSAEAKVQRDPTLLKGQARTLTELRAAYETAQSDFEKKRNAVRVSSNDAERAVAESVATQARSSVMALFDPLDGMRRRVLFEKVQQSYDEGKRVIFGAAVLIIVCVIAFAWAANPSEKSQAEATAREHGPTLEVPSLATVSVSTIRPSLAQLRTQLGRGCDLSGVKALVVGGDAAEPEIVTLPEDHCNAERFVVSQNIGIALPVSAH